MSQQRGSVWTTEETVQSPTTWAWGQWEHWASSGHGAKILTRGAILAEYMVSQRSKLLKTIEKIRLDID